MIYNASILHLQRIKKNQLIYRLLNMRLTFLKPKLENPFHLPYFAFMNWYGEQLVHTQKNLAMTYQLWKANSQNYLGLQKAKQREKVNASCFAKGVHNFVKHKYPSPYSRSHFSSQMCNTSFVHLCHYYFSPCLLCIVLTCTQQYLIILNNKISCDLDLCKTMKT